MNTNEEPTTSPSVILWCKLSLECSLQKAIVTEYPIAIFAQFESSVKTGSVQWNWCLPGPT